LENKSIKLFDLKGNQIEENRPIEFDFDLTNIEKFMINDGKIYVLDKNFKIHIRNVSLIKNYKMANESNKKTKVK
jgi:hypothetical protein